MINVGLPRQRPPLNPLVFTLVQSTTVFSLAHSLDNRKAAAKRLNATYPNIVGPAFAVPAKRSQHLNATNRNIVGRNILRAFGHRVATCCDRSRVENGTSAHTQA